MLDALLDVVPELLYGLVAAGLTAFGLLAELNGARTLAGGDQVVGVWMLFMGLLALYAGLLVTRDKLLPTLRTTRQ